MNDLISAFRDTALVPLADPTIDLAEIGFDSVLENDLIKAFPIVKYVAAFCKIGLSIHEKNLLKQTFEFIKGFRAGTIDETVVEKHRQELEANPRKQEQELSRVIVILGKQIDEIQSRVLGSFYKAFVTRGISWEKFCELAEANSRMFRSDYCILQEAQREDGFNLGNQEQYQIDRLISLGLLTQTRRNGRDIFDVHGQSMGRLNVSAYNEKDVVLTSFGKTFCQYMPENTSSTDLQ